MSYTDMFKEIDASDEVNTAMSAESVGENRDSLKRDSPLQDPEGITTSRKRAKLEVGRMGSPEAEIDPNADNNASSHCDKKPPQLKKKGNVNALKFFSQSYFFGDDDYKAITIKKMKQKGFENLTVRQVFLRFKTFNDLVASFNKMAFSSDDITEYYRSIQSAEDILNEKGIVSHIGVDEIKLLNQRYVALPSAAIVLKEGLRGGPKKSSRTLPVYMILGSSGSGKTFFALKEVASEIVGMEGGKAVVVYIKLSAYAISPGDRFEPSRLNESLRETFKKACDQDFITYPLHMRLIVIFDEAGAKELNGFFESYKNLEDVLDLLQNLTIHRPTLIVCGTALTGESLSSDRDIYKFHMKAWTLEDAGAILHFKKLPPLQIEKIKSAIPTQPILQALLVNGRSAYFLLTEIAQMHSRLELRASIYWVDRLSETTPSIVQSAVSQYISSNGLATLSPAEGFQVAASVLNAIEKGREKVAFPKFLDLPLKLKSRAFALIDLNVVFLGDKKAFIQTDVQCSVLVSPAIVIVLYTLMGVQAGVLTTWRSQELITAMFEFRRRVLSAYDPDLVASLRPDGKEKQNTDIVATLVSKSMEMQSTLELVQLVRPVPTPKGKVNFYLPVLEKDTTWINGEMAPFADVVAGNIFYQCKHTTGSKGVKECSFDVAEELFKCGLLRSQHEDSPGRIVLRGLHALWSCANTHHDENENTGSESLHPPRSLVSQHKSHAYPLNIIEGSPRQERTKYAHVRNVSDKWEISYGSEFFDLPELPDILDLTFVFSTNADVVKLDCDIDKVLSKDKAIRKKKKDEVNARKKCAEQINPASTESAEKDDDHDKSVNSLKVLDSDSWDMTKTLEVPVSESRTIDTSKALPGLNKHVLNGLVIKFLVT